MRFSFAFRIGLCVPAADAGRDAAAIQRSTVRPCNQPPRSQVDAQKGTECVAPCFLPVAPRAPPSFFDGVLFRETAFFLRSFRGHLRSRCSRRPAACKCVVVVVCTYVRRRIRSRRRRDRETRRGFRVRGSGLGALRSADAMPQES